MLNLVQLQERLKDLPMQAIMQYANGANPQVPPFLALGELNRRKKMQESAAAEQAQEMAGAPTVKQQIEQASGLMALQGARQRQAAQQQAGMQAAMPMAAPNTMTSEPAQLASGGAVNDVMQRDYRVGGVAGGMNPAILKKLMALKAMKQRKSGLGGLPMRADMFKRGDYAGGGIVAFQQGGAAADVINAAMQESEGVQEDLEETETGISAEEKDLRDVLRRIREVKTLEQMKQEAGLGQRPDDRAERLKALEAERQRFNAADTVARRVLALDPRRIGPSMGAYLEKREAGQTNIEARIAEVQDLKAKAAYDAKVGDLSGARANQLEALEKERGILKDIGGAKLKSAQTQQALAGRTTDWKRRYDAYLPEVMQRLDIDNPEHPRVKAATAKMVDESIGRTRERLEIQQQGVGAQIMGRNLDIENAITAATEKITKEYKFPLAQARAEGNTAEVARLTKERDEKISQRESDIRASGGQPAPSRAPAPKPSVTPAPTKKPDISSIQGAPAGATVGNFVAGRGWEIKDKNGKLIGYGG